MIHAAKIALFAETISLTQEKVGPLREFFCTFAQPKRIWQQIMQFNTL